MKRGRIVNRTREPRDQPHERHDASDFETGRRTSWKLSRRGVDRPPTRVCFRRADGSAEAGAGSGRVGRPSPFPELRAFLYVRRLGMMPSSRCLRAPPPLGHERGLAGSVRKASCPASERRGRHHLREGGWSSNSARMHTCFRGTIRTPEADPGRGGHFFAGASSLSCVLVSKSLASWRSCSWLAGRPEGAVDHAAALHGRARRRSASVQRWTCV